MFIKPVGLRRPVMPRFGQTSPEQQKLQTVETEIVGFLKNAGITAKGYFIQKREEPLTILVNDEDKYTASGILGKRSDITVHPHQNHDFEYSGVKFSIDTPEPEYSH